MTGAYAPFHEIVVDLEILAENTRRLIQAMRPARLCAVLKNNAYGHGLLECARVIAAQGVEDFAVVNNREIAILRDEGGRLLEQARIWRIRPPLPWELEEALERDWHVIEPVGSLEDAERALSFAAPMPVSVTLDCSMGREGFGVPSHLDDLVQAVRRLGPDRVRGLMSHLANADGDKAALETTHAELDDFDEAFRAVRHWLPDECMTHVGNSAASLRLNRVREDYDMVRCGAILFGEATSNLVALPEGIRPCLRWHSWIAQVRDVPPGARVGYGSRYVAKSEERLATLPVGYADGLKKTLADGAGEVLVRGIRCPVRGGISSSSAVISVAQVPGPPVQAGEEVVLIGEQAGQVQTPDELARMAGTGHLDLQTGIVAPIRYSAVTP
ncbi:alanine racemase [Aestuariispira insulae]|uniref:Alanine racemase n=1 Tax=Aestuariispira insulae TaxID=1461337 RepID=A0A3D9HVN0_9PROT|nr:alanine racemase [Aestuariispira insulae]RED53441.1 alanine racemase [Aestuariispira insulae]